MVTATFLAIFMVPMFFVVVRTHFGGDKEDAATAIANYEKHRLNGTGKQEH